MPTPLVARIPGHPLHLIQRGYCRAACFFGEGDRLAYLQWLGEYAGCCGCAVHAYVLMGNHVHLLVTPSRAGGVPELVRSLGERYERHVLEMQDRTEALWERRCEARPVQARRHLLGCMRYIELNPVRAALVAHPAAYRWSSYHANALGREDALVTPHPFYFALGRTGASRQAAYRALF